MQDDVIIRQANMNEIDKVMTFLKANWGENHVMANSRELMCYEHAWNGEFTFVIAEDRKIGKIYGVCGYIPYSAEIPRDMGGGIWQVIQNPHFLLGTEMFKYVQNHTGCRMFADCGANPSTKGHRKLLGHVNASLNHYYRLNTSVENFKVAKIKENRIPSPKNNISYQMIELKDINEFKRYFDVTKYKEILPYKDYGYIEHRYYNHIKYSYKIFGIKNHDFVDAVVIGRDFEANEKKVFRIIDFLGNEDSFAGTFDAWEDFLNAGDYEYVDFYEYGLKPENLIHAGFVKKDAQDPNIIPNYFEPFEQKNVEIHISTNIHGGFRMFKGDGDQDRPNLI